MREIAITIALALAMMVGGCAGYNHIETKINGADGTPLMTVESKIDGLVTYEEGGQKLTVDYRGKPSIFQTMVDAMLVKTLNDTD